MKIGIVFASTGGEKMVRALRSFRRAEPDLPVNIILDISSGTWKENSNPSPEYFETQPNVRLKCIHNSAYINGCLNAGMRLLGELGYDWGCLFHDDVIFSPLPENRGNLSKLFEDLNANPGLQQSSGLTLALMQAFVPNGIWRRAPKEWDSMDLESEELWQTLCPGGKPVGTFEPDGHAHEIYLPDFLVQYHVVPEVKRVCRLGPSGQIVPLATWNLIGGFDEKDGIFYDIHYPAECAVRKLPPILSIPNLPHLHLHNQSIGYADLAKDLWTNTMGAFTKRYGDYGAFWDREFSC